MYLIVILIDFSLITNDVEHICHLSLFFGIGSIQSFAKVLNGLFIMIELEEFVIYFGYLSFISYRGFL